MFRLIVNLTGFHMIYDNMQIELTFPSQLTGTQLAVDNGIDALVHVFVDEPISSALVAKIKRKGIFVVPTLSVEESFVDASGGAEVVADPRTRDYFLD